LSEQQRSVKSRGYQMRKRAEDVDRTRQRIVEATVHLHGTAGPAATSFAAIAERAGVTRLTVYRHFPDETDLFAACSGHWLAQHTPPRPDQWGEIEDPARRLRAGLADIYRFYRDGEQMLALVIRDAHAVPEPIRNAREEMIQRFADALTGEASSEGSDGAGRVRRALIGHAAAFSTWRSLCREQGLSDAEAAEAMARLVEVVGTEL
jgi:AcrR family transcriptional regulator